MADEAIGEIEAGLARWLRPGMRVVVGDGAAMPTSLLGPLSTVARAVGQVSLVLGWCLELPSDFDPTAFADVRTYMASAAVQRMVAVGDVAYVPARLSALPGLLAGAWRPDLFLTSARPGRTGLSLGSQVSWMPAAAAAAGTVIVELDDALPLATRRDDLAGVDAVVAAHSSRGPVQVPPVSLDDVSSALGRHVSRWINAGAAVQYGPGVVGAATLAALDVPVRIDSGIVTDAVVDLARRGLLLGTPRAGYLLGDAALYEWADGRRILSDVADLHDLRRLARERLVAVNTALEVDAVGQVAVESAGGRSLAGIGGHADYAMAATRAGFGVSIIALPTTRGGRSTLVDRLTGPTSTARSDVDVMVTENGSADLRGRSDRERRAAIEQLWS